MEINHGRIWSINTLLVGLVMLVLFYCGGISAIIGVIIGFVQMLLIAVFYANLLVEYEEQEEEMIRIGSKAAAALKEFDDVGAGYGES